jgi:hypothetical protein
MTDFEIIQNPKTTTITPTSSKLFSKIKRKTTKGKHKYTSSKLKDNTNEMMNFADEQISEIQSTTKNLQTTNSTISTKPKPLYACSNLTPPLITNENKSKKFNGLMVICFRGKNNVKVDCELCKSMCLSPTNDCPEDRCHCLWF